MCASLSSNWPFKKRWISPAGRSLEVNAVGLDTPGPISGDGVLCSKGATNFANEGYWNFDLRGALSKRLALPVSFLNDGNAAALYAHWRRFGADRTKTSVSLIVGTGLGGGVVTNGEVLIGRVGFAAELGHVTLPGDWYPHGNIPARCNCGKNSDLESVASLTGIELNLLPYFLKSNSSHPLAALPAKEAAKKVRGLAVQGDEFALTIFRAQATARLGAHIDQMINVFDPRRRVYRRWGRRSIRAVPRVVPRQDPRVDHFP